MFPFEQVAVVGVGLLGGSFALALRVAGYRGRIHGIGRSRERLEFAQSRKVIDAAFTDAAEGVAGADLVCLAAPVAEFLPIVKAFSPGLKRGAVVTDVGSVKGTLVGKIEAALPPGVDFVGAHPIAGGEEAGVAHARGDLFTGAVCVVTPTPNTAAAALSTIADLWEQLGTRVIRMDPHEHDRLYGAVSHLPHVIAYALVDAVVSGHGGDWAGLCGAGFRDTTRIAASSPEIWSDILRLNRENVLESLQIFLSSLEKFREALEGEQWDDLQKLMESARRARRDMDAKTPGPEDRFDG